MAHRFTGDGYIDREMIAEGLVLNGSLFQDRKLAEIAVAAVCAQLLDDTNSQQEFSERAWDLWSSVNGIVDCAEKDGLL